MKTWYQLVAQIGQLDRTIMVTVLGVLGFNSFSAVAVATAWTGPPRGFSSTSLPPLTVAEARPQKKRIMFKLPERGVPPSRISGGARSACASNSPYLPLTAITPLTPNDANAEFEMVSPTPVFYLYIPKTSVGLAEFSLKDRVSNQTIFEQRIKIAKTGGIVKFALPEAVTNKMNVSHHYGWYFSLLCDPSDTSSILLVGGGFRPVQHTADFWSKVKSTPETDLAPFYAANGYWIDAIDTLSQLRQKYPQNPTFLQDWKELMKAVKLENLAEEPILIDWYQDVSPQI